MGIFRQPKLDATRTPGRDDLADRLPKKTYIRMEIQDKPTCGHVRRILPPNRESSMSGKHTFGSWRRGLIAAGLAKPK